MNYDNEFRQEALKLSDEIGEFYILAWSPDESIVIPTELASEEFVLKMLGEAVRTSKECGKYVFTDVVYKYGEEGLKPELEVK